MEAPLYFIAAGIFNLCYIRNKDTPENIARNFLVIMAFYKLWVGG